MNSMDSARRLSFITCLTGLAVVLGGMALALKWAGDALGDAGSFWNGLALLLGPAIFGALLILSGEAVKSHDGRMLRWHRIFGVLALVAILALAVKSSETRMLLAGAETGAWGFLRAVLSLAPLAAFVLLVDGSLHVSSKPHALMGLLVGAATIIAALLVGLHIKSEAPAWELWTFIGFVIGPIAVGLLIVTASLASSSGHASLLKSWAIGTAGLVVFSSSAHSVWLADLPPENGVWIAIGNLVPRLSLALMILLIARAVPPTVGVLASLAIGVAACAHAVWFVSSPELSANDAWALVLLATSSFALAVLPLFFSLGQRVRAQAGIEVKTNID
jgi:hypothetical protein